MSIKVMTYIWEESRQKGSALLLLLAIGDHAHDDGTGAYPSVDTLSRKARMTSRNTRLLLNRLTASGELTIEPAAGPHGANVYTIPLKTFQGEIQGTTPEILGMLPLKAASAKSSSESSRNHHIPITIDEAFRKQMEERFGTVLNVGEIIEEALAHVNSKKWTDKQAYVRNWLRRAAERKGQTNGKSQWNLAEDKNRPLTVYKLPPGQPILGSKPKTML